MTTTPTSWLTAQTVNGTDSGPSGNDQYEPRIVALTNGNFVVLWTDNSDAGAGFPTGTDIIGQLFDPLGVKLGSEMLINSGRSTHDEGEFDAAALSTGGFVVAFEQTSSSGTDIFAVEWDADASHSTLRSILSNSYRPDLGGPSVSAADDGTYIVAYQENSASDTTTYARYVNPATNTFGAEQTIFSGSTPLNDQATAATWLYNGGHVITSRYDQASGDDAIEFRPAFPTGTASFVSNTHANGEVDSEPDIAALSGGGFVVTWVNTDTDSDIFFQRYNDAGTALGGVTAVDANGLHDAHVSPAIAALDDGGFVIVWDANEDTAIKGQRYDASGAAVGSVFTIATDNPLGYITDPHITRLGDGRFAVAWTGNVSGNNDVRMAIWDPRTSPILGTGSDDILTSRIEGASVDGLSGDDTLYGMQGDDVLYGGPGNDTLHGNGGNDTFYYINDSGSINSDLLHGGDGHDRLLLEDSGSYDFRNCTFSAIEEITFSANGSDNDKIAFFAAGSFRSGHLAPDLRITGNDAVNSTEQIQIQMQGETSLNLSSLTFQDWGAQDELITIIGGPNNETIHGTSQFDHIITGTGDDYLDGGDGRDLLDAGEGNDTLNGGPGKDWMFGGPGDDTYFVQETYDFIDEGVAFPTLPGGGNDTLISMADWYYESSFTIENLWIFDGIPGTTTLVAGGNDNLLSGNSGDNNLYANWGNDTIWGKAGFDHIDLSDRSAGAIGANTVMFETGNGYDIIWNFAPGIDKVDLVPFSLTGFAELQTHGFNDGYGNCYFALGPTGTDYLYFVGLEVSDLNAHDFVFS